MQPLLRFGDPVTETCNPYYALRPRGGQQCNPYNSFGGLPLGLFFGTPTTGSGSGAAKM